MNSIIQPSYLAVCFQEDVHKHISEIEEKELKIILALSDLLSEPYEEDFIRASLDELKKNYGLTKSVWHVLLRLYDIVPNFSQKLSHWKFSSPYHPYQEESLKYISTIGSLPLANNNREYSIQKMFSLIAEMSKHFDKETVCKLIGLFSEDFDIQKSPYSYINFSKQHQKGELETSVLLFFPRQLSSIYNLYHRLSSIAFVNEYREKFYVENHRRADMERKLQQMHIPYKNEEETFQSIFTTYQKYTKEPFVTCKGMEEVMRSPIEEKDKQIIDALLREYHKTERYNQNKMAILISLLKFTESFQGDMEKYLEKRDQLMDYINLSKEIQQKLVEPTDFSLKNILIWSSQWHLKGENKKERRDFKVHPIDREVDNYYFEQIKNTDDLYDQGRLQSHCVYSYAKHCEEGKAIIISMKNREKNIVSTLRLRIKKGNLFQKSKIKLVENRKKFNKSCNKEESSAASKYFELIKGDIAI